MSDLPALLLASLAPATRKEAEQQLAALGAQPGFLSHLLQLVLAPAADRPARLAGAVYLKNAVRLRWVDVRQIACASRARTLTHTPRRRSTRSRRRTRPRFGPSWSRP
jgi:hypothetical protein